jgi:hypothetical protein
MGSLLSHVTAIVFMEDFEEVVLSRIGYKHACWFCYVDAAFIIWPHGPKELSDFVNCLNNICPNIQFTMEKLNHHLPFMDMDIYRRPDGSLGHNVYRKPTHTNLYLNAESHYHPASKHFVLPTLVH